MVQSGAEDFGTFPRLHDIEAVLRLVYCDGFNILLSSSPYHEACILKWFERCDVFGL